MFLKIKKIETASKLPGYLFVLAGITDIGDEVFLSCTKERYEFTSSMMNLIGIQVHPLTKKVAVPGKTLFLLKSISESNYLITVLNNSRCRIAYVEVNSVDNDLEKKIRHFLTSNTQCILIVNESLTVSKKYFSIYIDPGNMNYIKLQQYILKSMNTYRIQEFAIC